MNLNFIVFAFGKHEITLTPEDKEIFEIMTLLGALVLERV